MRARPLLIIIGMLAVMVFTGIQLHVSGQGDLSETYPKGFRGGTCTIESDALLIGYSAYFVPADYAIPEDAISALSVPVLCGKVPQTGVLDVTIDLLYPQSARNWALALSLVRMGKDGSAEAVFSVPPRNYERGTMTHAIRIGETGDYRLYLYGRDENQAEVRMEISITVGTKWYESIINFWPMLLLTVAAIAFYNFRKIFH
jgi:hypothetical protein